MTEENIDKTHLQQHINNSRHGDESALNHLAEYLLPKAFEFASHRLRNLSPVDDFEDIAISAVKSICLRFRRGEHEFLGEKELSGLLRQFVIGKIRDRRKYHYAEKRDIKLNIAEEHENANMVMHDHATAEANSVWLDEHSAVLSVDEQTFLENIVNGLGADVQGLFSELVKRLDDNPRKVLMLITENPMSNMELADLLDCAPTSIERYRRAIRTKLEQIVNE